MEQCRDVELREDTGNTIQRGQKVLDKSYTQWSLVFWLKYSLDPQYLIVFLFPSNIKLVEIRNGARSKTLNWYKIRI